MSVASKAANAANTERPAYGTAPIRCGKTRCKFRGMETDLVSVPHKSIAGMTNKVCPKCGCTSYMFMTEKEIVAWKQPSGNSVEAANHQGAIA